MHQQAIIESKIQKTNQIIARSSGQVKMQQSSFRMESIMEEDDESHSEKQSIKQNKLGRPKEIEVRADRFDFRFNNRYRIDNVVIDSKGERI